MLTYTYDDLIAHGKHLLSYDSESMEYSRAIVELIICSTRQKANFSEQKTTLNVLNDLNAHYNVYKIFYLEHHKKIQNNT